MNDLNKAFGDSNSTPQGGESINYGHPMADVVLQECRDLLSEIPEGQRLLAYAKDNVAETRVITGKTPDFRIENDNTVFLICPINTKTVNLYEMAGNLAIAIRSVEHKDLGIARPDMMNPSPDLPEITLKHFVDIILEMCKITGEFEDVKNNSKLVDLLEKMGHGEIYREYRSGKTEQELTEALRVIVTSV